MHNRVQLHRYLAACWGKSQISGVGVTLAVSATYRTEGLVTNEESKRRERELIKCIPRRFKIEFE